MKFLRETTDWGKENTPNHIYVLDGDFMVAYIQQGTNQHKVFSKPIRFSKTGRTFDLIKDTGAEVPAGRAVAGSKGAVYYVTADGCTCPGFTYRGDCKHVKETVNG